MTAALSLFSGCGGDTLGMTNAGLDVTWYSELKRPFQKTHDANFPGSTCIGGDITTIHDDTFRALRGRVDVIFAGFPCQSFSHAGKKRADDTRGQLYLDFVRATACIEPSFIIGENVKGLLARKTNTGEPFIQCIVRAFKDIGYTCDYALFPVVQYGVPQTRERLLIVGWKDPAYVHEWPAPAPASASAPAPGLQGILTFDMDGAVEVPDELFVQAGVAPESILDGQGEPYGTAHPYLVDRVNARGISYMGKAISDYCFSFGKRISPVHCEIVDITKPSKTIISTYDHQPRLFVAQRVGQKKYLRPYTIDELKQIQGFPKTYRMEGTRKEQIVQLGNAVPPPLVQRVVESMLRKTP